MMNKRIFLASLCLILPALGAHAQSVPNNPSLRLPLRSQAADEPGATLKGNYLLTLTTKRKDQTEGELAVMIAAPSFNTASSEPNTQLTGKLTPQEDGTYLVSYTLNSVVTGPNGDGEPGKTLMPTFSRTVTTFASVLLNLGEAVQILKDGDLTYTLKIEKAKPEGGASVTAK